MKLLTQVLSHVDLTGTAAGLVLRPRGPRGS